jgi:hypothetical protein
MTRETIYLVQSFNVGRGNGLKADTPIRCKSADVARRTAERLAQTKVGVMALSTSGDSELGEYDEEPTFLYQAGRLPPQYEK